jgi:hypothetical protein
MSWRMKLHVLAMAITAGVCIWFYNWLTSPPERAPRAAGSGSGVVYIDVNPGASR